MEERLGFVFDFIGTLVNAEWNQEALFDEIIAGLKAIDINLTSLEGYRFSSLLDRAAEIGIKKAVEEKDVRNLIFSICDKYHLDALRRWRLKEGAKEVLDWLKKKDHFLALLSTVGARAISEALKKFGLDEYFQVVVTRDSGFPIKPRPEALKYIIDISGLPVHKLLLIGDSLDDVLAAKAVGMKVMIITSGTSGLENLNLIRQHVEYIVNDWYEAKKVLAVFAKSFLP